MEIERTSSRLYMWASTIHINSLEFRAQTFFFFSFYFSLSLSLSSFIPFPSPISGSLIHYPISTPRPTDQQNHHSLLRDRSAFLDNIVIALFHVSIYLVNNCSWSWVLQKQIKSPNSILLKNNNPIGMTIMT
jgi:hypothetical protein